MNGAGGPFGAQARPREPRSAARGGIMAISDAILPIRDFSPQASFSRLLAFIAAALVLVAAALVFRWWWLVPTGGLAAVTIPFVVPQYANAAMIDASR